MLSCRDLAQHADRYLDRELPFWERLEIRLHMILCRHCSRYMNQLRLTLAALRRSVLDEPPSQANDMVEQLLHTMRASPPESAAAGSEVVIYTTPWCPYCRRAKALLQRRNVPYREVDVAGDPVRRREMTALAAGRTTVPQIFIGGHGVGGCDELYALDSTGELERLLHRA